MSEKKAIFCSLHVELNVKLLNKISISYGLLPNFKRHLFLILYTMNSEIGTTIHKKNFFLVPLAA